jgi:hypothetical protein
MRLAQALEKGTEPPQPFTPSVYRLRSMAIVAERSVPWEQLAEEHMPVRSAVPLERSKG